MLYDWQIKCLALEGVLGGSRNLIFSAPTSGGKTLISEVLLINKLMSPGGCKALYILPYVSIVDEKAAYFKRYVKNIY